MTCLGWRRVEEAKVFDDDAGVHHNDKTGTDFEVFWSDGNDTFRAGWYWTPHRRQDPWAPVNPSGPFASSTRAYQAALED